MSNIDMGGDPPAPLPPERIDQMVAAARGGATWRAELGLPEPSPRLADAIESLGRVARAAPLQAGGSAFDAVLTAAREDHPGETALDQLVRRARCSRCSRNGEPGDQPEASDTRCVVALVAASSKLSCCRCADPKIDG